MKSRKNEILENSVEDWKGLIAEEKERKGTFNRKAESPLSQRIEKFGNRKYTIMEFFGVRVGDIIKRKPGQKVTECPRQSNRAAIFRNKKPQFDTGFKTTKAPVERQVEQALKELKEIYGEATLGDEL